MPEYHRVQTFNATADKLGLEKKQLRCYEAFCSLLTVIKSVKLKLIMKNNKTLNCKTIFK